MELMIPSSMLGKSLLYIYDFPARSTAGSPWPMNGANREHQGRYFWMPGDINFDRKIDIYDLSIVGAAFGSYDGDPPHPRWNPLADVNGDGKVDIVDMSIVASNFGKEY
jgi:hypothetical protein